MITKRDDLAAREPDYEIIEFTRPLNGWYAIKKDQSEVILSMVISLEEGKGHVTSLLADWMTRFPRITVPTPSNRMRGICERRGFKSEMVWFEEFGEHGECMVWNKQL